VKQSHWAAGYIKTAVTAGWFAGYSDGTFRPSNNIKLEEAATALLRMLGYTDAEDFGGVYPKPQLALFKSVGLGDGVARSEGGVVTRGDCVQMFYNLLCAKTKSGQSYATTIGMALDSTGHVDYTALVASERKGPYVNDGSWTSTLPFSLTNAEVYLNGRAASAGDVANYDVYYYNPNLRTVWAYRNSITGVYTSAAPSTAMPSAVVLSGATYTLSTAAAAFELSDAGSFHPGDNVTLLLGMEGDVVAAVDSALTDTTLVGVVQSCGTNTYTDGYGGSWSSTTVTLVATNGMTYTYPVSGTTSLDAGDLVSVQTASGKTTVRGLSAKSISGTVSSSGTAVGQTDFASDVRILDTVNAQAVTVLASRLAGMKLSSSNVRYYATDSNGRICDLILKDATGDMDSYGILTSVSEVQSPVGLGISSVYEFILNGSTSTIAAQNKAFGVHTGPASFRYTGGQIDHIRNLEQTALTYLSGVSAKNNSTEYGVYSGTTVYVKRDGGYYLSNIATVSDTGVYTLTGYYDKPYTDGGRVRIVIAVAK
jgi:hypothetical protein